MAFINCEQHRFLPLNILYLDVADLATFMLKKPFLIEYESKMGGSLAR